MSFSPTPLASTDAQLRQRSFLSQVYAWMTAGLLVSSAVASYAASAPLVLNLLYGNPFTIWILFLAQIGLVIGLSARIDRLTPLTAVALFIGYAALNGLTLSAIFLVYTLTSWRVPAGLSQRSPVLYGEPLFADVVAGALGVALLQAPFGWLPALPERYRQREVTLTTLALARQQRGPAFFKPADDKCFPAQIYASGAELPDTTMLPAETPVLSSEPVIETNPPQTAGFEPWRLGGFLGWL